MSISNTMSIFQSRKVGLTIYFRRNKGIFIERIYNQGEVYDLVKKMSFY